MEQNVLRLRFVSLKDVANQSIPNTLLYVKKLAQIPANKDAPAVLEESNPTSSIVLSLNQTFDWRFDAEEYFQILFLQSSKTQTTPIADIVLRRNYLLELVNDSRHNKQLQPELLCTVKLERGYQFAFSLQVLEHLTSTLNDDNCSSLMSSRSHHPHPNDKPVKCQQIRGHLMCVKQFNHPVYCAICNKFIWGLHRQGCECQQCAFVTHRKCRHQIPFWCRKSPNPETNLLNGNHRFKIHIPHIFRPHEAPLIRSLLTSDRGHCSHCGSQIVRHALKCTQCHFVIHEHCQANVPDMCTVPYISVAAAMIHEWSNAIEPVIILSPSSMSSDQSIEPENHHSKSSSFDLTWLEELPSLTNSAIAGRTIPPPTFADFKYLGRLGNGAFAKVFCAEHLPSKRRVAIKVIDGLDEQARQQLEIEKQILFRYGHKNPYMIKAYCTFHRRNKLFLVMELVEGGTLFQKIQKTRMNEDEIRFYLAELICVVQFLHANNIVYRDLKLEHAIVCSEGHVRLVDFGLGRLLKHPAEKCHTVCGTYGYMAPEVWSLEKGPAQNGYSFPVDFWALGVIFIQMLCGEQFDLHPEFHSFSEDDTIHPVNIAQNLQFPRHISSEAQACATALLEEDPEKRLGSPKSPHGSIRNHAFFKAGRSIDWQEVEEGVFKPIYKSQSSMPFVSNIYSDRSLMDISVVRQGAGEADWMAAGQATITAPKDDQFASFDYVDQQAWLEFIQGAATSTAVTPL